MDELAHWRGHVVVLLLNGLCLALTAWWLRSPTAGAVRVLPPPTATPAPAPTPVRLVVYVSGAVARPGLVKLAEGARAAEAIAAAGGLTGAADPVAVNLAARVADGEQLHVPVPGEAPPAAAAVTGPGPGGPAPGSAVGSNGPAVNLNTASAAELEALPSIGPALAERILAHRTSHGPFRTVRELLDVPGVGEKTLARFADRLTVR